MTLSYPLLRLRNVKTHFPIRGGLFGKTVHFVKSVDGVSLDIDRGGHPCPGGRKRLRENDSRQDDPEAG
jgi:hypothetical protein